MQTKRKQRLYIILAIMFAVSAACALLLFALRQNINFFFSPTQVFAGEAPPTHLFRLGGLVKEGSVQRDKQDNLQVHFVVTDRLHDVNVQYRGILPDLFKPGRDVVTEGHLTPQGMFVAEQVLAKHDNSYMPPEVKRAISLAQKYQMHHQQK